MLPNEAAVPRPNLDLEANAFVERRIELLSRLISSAEIGLYHSEGLEQMLGIYKRY